MSGKLPEVKTQAEVEEVLGIRLQSITDRKMIFSAVRRAYNKGVQDCAKILHEHYNNVMRGIKE